MPKGGSDARACTEARYELILGVLRFHSPATPAQVTEVLHVQIGAGSIEWPPAPWAGAVAGPYDAGTRQMLEQMVRKGWAKRVRDVTGVAQYVPKRSKRRVRAGEALALKAQGLTGKQIAERMGISPKLASSLTNDPFGDKERERKKRYCPGCGAKKKTGAQTCEVCVTKRAEALLPPETFADLARDYERDTGCPVVFGVTHGMRRVIRILTDRGMVEHQVRTDQGWEEAAEELLA